MWTAPVVVRDPLAKDSSEVAFVERDQPVETLVPTEKSNENTALISKAATPHGSPRRTPDGALEIPDIRENSAQHRCVERTGGRSVGAGIAVGRRLRGDAVVAVVQPADFWNGDNATG
jgi:hypothetical protein